MKRWTSLLLALLMALSLPACGGPAVENGAEDPPVSEGAAAAGEDDGTGDREEPEELPPEPEPEIPWEWTADAPENQGVDPGMLDNVHATFDTFPLLASVIVRNGKIVDEYYKEGYDADSVFVLHSSSKSVTSALIGIAIDEGYIHSVDDPISDYLPQVLELGDDAWGEITIWHLLTHTSGIYSTDNELWNQWLSSENWVDYILDLPIVSTPGEVFSYSTGNTHLLCAILQEATGMTVYAYGKPRLFDPLDMDSVQCGADPQGISDGGNGFAMDVYDMAKFGQLYLNGGVWEGEQIVPADWVAASTSLQFKRSSGSADYGYQWWVRTFGQEQYPAYFAQGHGGQYIFVVPQLELVAAFTSDYTGRSSVYWQLMNDIVAGCAVSG